MSTNNPSKRKNPTKGSSPKKKVRKLDSPGPKTVPINDMFVNQVDKMGFLTTPGLYNQLEKMDREAVQKSYTGTLTYVAPESKYTYGSDYRKYTITVDYKDGVKQGYQAVFFKQIFDEATDVWIVQWDKGQKHGFECFYEGVERCQKQSVPTPVYVSHWYLGSVLFKALYNFSLGISDPSNSYFDDSNHCYAEGFFTHTGTTIDCFGAVYVQRESGADYTEHELVDVYGQTIAKPGGHNRVLSKSYVAADILKRYTYLEEYYCSRW